MGETRDGSEDNWANAGADKASREDWSGEGKKVQFVVGRRIAAGTERRRQQVIGIKVIRIAGWTREIRKGRRTHRTLMRPGR